MAPLRLVFAVRSPPTLVSPRDSGWADGPAGTEERNKASGVRQRRRTSLEEAPEADGCQI